MAFSELRRRKFAYRHKDYIPGGIASQNLAQQSVGASRDLHLAD